jgi:hypothetical protein
MMSPSMDHPPKLAVTSSFAMGPLVAVKTLLKISVIATVIVPALHQLGSQEKVAIGFEVRECRRERQLVENAGIGARCSQNR